MLKLTFLKTAAVAVIGLFYSMKKIYTIMANKLSIESKEKQNLHVISSQKIMARNM